MEEHYSGKKNWLKWGPYVSERAWGTVREDYSADGAAWEYLTHDQARSRAYRWGEDGIAGISNDHQELCFALALWNGRDPILKERLFGLNSREGNHGEDVKELYYYLDNTPTHSYMEMLYKYPQSEFPYADLLEMNKARTRVEGEYELLDTGIFDGNKYFDVFIEYAKVDDEDVLIKITACNRGEESAEIHLLPTLWFRNRWDFGLVKQKPSITVLNNHPSGTVVQAQHQRLGIYNLYLDQPESILITENETNEQRIFNTPNKSPFVKDTFHRVVIENNVGFLSKKTEGTKCAPWYRLDLAAGQNKSIRLRFTNKDPGSNPLGADFDRLFKLRSKEADDFYAEIQGIQLTDDLKNIQRQALAGLLWSKQYYNLDIPRWLNGDPGQPPPPESRKNGRNKEWQHFNSADIISMPDKWEYPWFAAWDLAFHCVPMAMLDATFAKNQLILILREWYMQPNGQIPAYEWSFSDVNPPVHAWAALKVYEIDKKNTGKGDINFLKRVFQKLMLNFTWWVNRKDKDGNNLFEGGFLGLDNIGVFDRSEELPDNVKLIQADGTCWMGMYALNMMEMAITIALEDPAFEDVCTKFFEHFIYIAESLNEYGINKEGLWSDQDGIFYDKLYSAEGDSIEIKVKSLVGLTALFGTSYIPRECLDSLKDFQNRVRWFRNYRKNNDKYLAVEELKENQHILLSMVHEDRFKRMLGLLLDENEFLSASGIRSVSRFHKEHHYTLNMDHRQFTMSYDPGEATTGMYGGNSNWRGPVWMPMNYLLIEALYKYYDYYEDNLKIEFPTGSGNLMNLKQVAQELSKRLIGIFQKDHTGNRKVHGGYQQYAQDPNFKELILIYEYFHAENGRGVGASHQTGWTSVIAEMISRVYGPSSNNA